MVKLMTVLLFGLFFWTLAIASAVMALYVHYIQANGIDLYFNRFFIDVQRWWLWPVGILLYGAAFTWGGRKAMAGLFLVSLAVIGALWTPQWGREVGERLFAVPHALYRFDIAGIQEVTRLYSIDGVDFVRLSNGKIAKFPAARRMAKDR
jgi:hypothetical protein